MSLVDYSHSIWSLVPALLALSLAMFTRKVILSLSIGIIIGSFMLTNGDVINGLIYIKNSIISLVYSDGELNSNNINIVLFLLLLGVLTTLLSTSGSNQAFANWAQEKIKGRRGAKLMTASLVFFTFIDDYFHSLAVGAIARPVTDKFKISRAKLAYILDSTAAPMCVLMPVSSWGAYIITLVASLLATHSITQYSSLGAFMTMSLMNFYAIFSMIMVFVVAYFSFDIASMARFEEEAMNQKVVEEESATVVGKVRNLVLPIATLILVTVAMMIYTGYDALASDGKAFSLLGAFENTTVGISLVVGSIVALVVVTFFLIIDGQFNISDYTKSWGVGIKSMSGAILILCFAWTINGVIGDMQTGKYLSTLVTGNMSPAFLPAILFVLAAGMAFSTGTSWGTFGIMLPIAASMAVHADPTLILPCLSAVMAGAVCGDHCSPISDTTILSSTGAQCNHIDHVTSQLPYAMLVAVATIFGYLTLGFSGSLLASFAVTGSIFVALIFIFKKKGK
ncbi:Na+/H+ antiporter NhaC family protein [Pasteurella skyensis]|uniref:Na+/H+ antiporter NhaC family protein n=1 Tax=Phocoenobacter skyensis TaxID=97481 RepID=A0AAJ6NAL4_9PAST|nr:Na+/H+ antiporter NhaC family protein [Pasteurella skyensis]MDP8163272.1 Na+/H+ antiporter NhaC family protein [Pasteurella skyensis]MDP8173261.1 Na+/H+ antiporter NhaC family protein [Pasteurella skyensis]MDP8176914.1 Na+/H+ antiporter NhaC family protein [Pasteurella skyensis]MDP8179671.1 Na+/H+ antiporter NhaC family protein [Pasteurella skyensis]MDP8182736.1 Na+/H+ antiporter NhaC family protein [Pasteurella skyensis]